MIVYLSGAMEFAENEGAEWRKNLTTWLESELGHTSIDPVVESAKIVAENNAHDYREWKTNKPEKYADFIRLCVLNDINIVMNKADYLICLWDQNVMKGAGTHAEITLAFMEQKPVYLVNMLSPKDLSGWIMACSTKIFSNFSNLKKHLKRKYLNGGA